MSGKHIDRAAFDYLGDSVQTAATIGSASEKNVEADVVIVGAGPGGLTTGAILAEGGMDVIVVEAGQLWDSDDFERDMSWASEHLYQGGNQRLLRGNALFPLAMGKGVGGGTLVNSGICFRAPDRILEEWVSRFGLDFWEQEHRRQLYRRIEDFIGVSRTEPSIAGNNAKVARRGFEKLGLEHHGYMPRNFPGCIGCGTCHTGCPVGGKASADVTWLPRMLEAGGRLYTDARVDEIFVDTEQHARGIRAGIQDPETNEPLARLSVDAERVILAAGTVNTPLLLLKEGLANSSGLVGEKLRVQPGTGVFAKMSEDVLLWKGATQGYYAHHPDDPEVMLETFSSGNGALFTQADVIGYEGVEFLRDIRRVATCGALHRDVSEGTVSRNDDGSAALTYFISGEDQRKFQKGLLKNIEMFFEAGADSVMPGVSGSRFYKSPNEALDRVRRTSSAGEFDLYASHPLGTCRMHEDPNKGVVRPQDGRTHDVEGLYITDASIFPTSLGVNPQVTIMGNSIALAERMLEQA
jgi:choline dehydrogenase-like flavoprotein